MGKLGMWHGLPTTWKDCPTEFGMLQKLPVNFWRGEMLLNQRFVVKNTPNPPTHARFQVSG